MQNHQRLLYEIHNPETLPEPRRSLLSPSPLAHSKHLQQELPTLRRHVGPGPWYEWLEKANPLPSRF